MLILVVVGCMEAQDFIFAIFMAKSSAFGVVVSEEFKLFGPTLYCLKWKPIQLGYKDTVQCLVLTKISKLDDRTPVTALKMSR